MYCIVEVFFSNAFCTFHSKNVSPSKSKYVRLWFKDPLPFLSFQWFLWNKTRGSNFPLHYISLFFEIALCEFAYSAGGCCHIDIMKVVRAGGCETSIEEKLPSLFELYFYFFFSPSMKIRICAGYWIPYSTAVSVWVRVLFRLLCIFAKRSLLKHSQMSK